MLVYLDNAATTQVRPEAAEIMLKTASEDFGNPSSTHALGRRAAATLDAARENIARALGARAQEIIFTSGGTEANNLALLGAAEARRRRGRHIITTQTEHDSVRHCAEKLARDGWDVTLLPPDGNGRISAQSVAQALRKDTVLVSVMLVNNEVGTVNPVPEIAQLLRASGALLHTDAVQGFLKLPFTVKSLGADLVTVTAHKLHGPKGVGALYVRGGTRLTPRVYGGGQEEALRPGTQALPLIAAFGEAVRLAELERGENNRHVASVRAHAVWLITQRIPQAVLLGGDSPYILSVSLPGYLNENIVNFLDGEGVCVSRSSACKKGAKSHVLEAMRLPAEVAGGTLRVSFSHYSTIEEATYFVEKLEAAAARLMKALR